MLELHNDDTIAACVAKLVAIACIFRDCVCFTVSGKDGGGSAGVDGVPSAGEAWPAPRDPGMSRDYKLHLPTRYY